MALLNLNSVQYEQKIDIITSGVLILFVTYGYINLKVWKISKFTCKENIIIWKDKTAPILYKHYSSISSYGMNGRDCRKRNTIKIKRNPRETM